VTATKSWGPTLTETVGREVDYQVAAPTETRTPTLHRANIAHTECGWKDGDRGGLVEWELALRKKKVKVCLTSTGLLMEGLGLLYLQDRALRVLVESLRLHPLSRRTQTRLAALDRAREKLLTK
jgi:hypothetical protein